MRYSELFFKHQALMQRLADTTDRLSQLPDGYISRKKIRGKIYPYLQKRYQGKMQSRYIKAEQLSQVSQQLNSRAALEQEITALAQEMDALEKAAALLDAALQRRILQSKRSLQMDRLPASARTKSLSFADAMLSLEGVSPTSEAKHTLQAWSVGKNSFSRGYHSVLQKYNLISGDDL